MENSSSTGENTDGAEATSLTEPESTAPDIPDNNVTSDHAEEPTSADPELAGEIKASSSCEEGLGMIEDQIVAGDHSMEEANEGGDEMDIDEPSTGIVAEDSAYIGDNCLSTPAVTEDNSPQESDNQLEPLLKEESLDPESAATQEESPDQSINSSMPIDSAVREAEADTEGPPIVQDDESSTMDDDIGGGEGVASSDDVNDISSAVQESLATAISSSSAEGSDITSSGNAESALISSTNGPPSLHSFALSGQQANEFGDADTSEVDGAADTMPSESESMPTLTTSNNITSQLPTSLLSGEENSAGGAVSSSGSLAAEAESAVSSSAPAPLPPTDAAHALATLASAAIRHHEQTESEEIKPQNDEDVWYTVGIVKGTTFTVQNYLSDPNIDLSNLTLDNITDLSGYATTPLEHGTAYKFRLAAVNSCGRGDFSEESAFKTCLPGFPGAPSAIKISKSAEGAHLSWEPPQVAAEGIFEYSVYLAVRSNTQSKEASKSQLAFVRVYCGKANTCIVPQSSLSAAHVDSSTKPAIIFRIAARNDKGYGPATQVRWLQDIKSAGIKRAGDGRLPGASPSKQVKQLVH